MLKNDESRILLLLKLSPIFLILVSVFISYYTISVNNNNFKKEQVEIEQDAIKKSKSGIKREVEKVYDLIQYEKNQAEDKLKQNIKNRVYEAHTIAMSIYNNNKYKSKLEITTMIKNTLRDIRFNNGRGYFFIYDLEGINILSPAFLNKESQNAIRMKDSKGNYPVREIISLVKKEKEGFTKWWWAKPSSITKQYEKIGFSKVFEPFNWVIVTGEYIVDWEHALQKEILSKIQKIHYAKNRYVFIVDYNGTFISHIKPSLIGQNRINTTDAKGYYATREVVNTAKKGEGFISYVGTIKPTTGEPAEKTSFIKGFDQWKWAIGSGVYMSDINEDIMKRQNQFHIGNKEQIINIMTITIITFIMIFAFSIYSSLSIKRRFQAYKETVSEQKNELLKFNSTLENTVKKRTLELKKANDNQQEIINELNQTQNQLIESEKMASLGGLVAGVAHEINTPIGICLTAVTHFTDTTQKLGSNYHNDTMTEEIFESYLNESKDISTILHSNIGRTAELVKSFKQIAVDQTSEEKRLFNLDTYLDEIILSLQSLIKQHNINVSITCSKELKLYSYAGAFSQVITNLIINTIKHAFKEDNERIIDIIVTSDDENIEIRFKDNGVGIHKENQEHIFDPFFTTNREGGGTGLGLNIVYNIMTSTFNGTIRCESTPKKGTTFILIVPLKKNSLVIDESIKGTNDAKSKI